MPKYHYQAPGLLARQPARQRPLPARGYQVGVNASAVSECYTPLES